MDFTTRNVCAAAIATIVALLAIGCSPKPKTGPADRRAPAQVRPTIASYEARLKEAAEPVDQVRKEALAYLAEVIAEQPACFPARWQRAQWLVAWDRPREALGDFAALEKEYGAQPDCSALHGKALYMLGREREAREYFRRSLALDPRSEHALLHLGIMLAESGRYDTARQYLKRVAEVHPGNTRARKCLAAVEIAADPEKLGDARKFSDAATARRVGLLLVAAGRYQPGVSALLVALRENPKDVEALKAAAHGFSRRGMHRNAMRLLRRAVHLETGDADAHYDLGAAYSQLGRRKIEYRARAAKHFARAAELRPGEPRPLQAAAKTCERVGNILGAMKYYEMALKAGPREADFYLDYGRFLARNARLMEAEKVYRKGLEKHPQDARIKANLMAALFEIGRFEEARRLRDELAVRKELPKAVGRLLAKYTGGDR